MESDDLVVFYHLTSAIYINIEWFYFYSKSKS